MSKRFRFSEAARVLIATTTAATIALSPVAAMACTQVYVGSQLTTTGDTMYGRSEDAANRYAKAFGIEPATQGKEYWSGENGAEHDESINFHRVSPGATFRYTYVRDTPEDWDGASKPYSEAGINEKGVSVDATLTTTCNDKIAEKDPLVDAGIGEYNVTDVLLSECSTAREGVELLGKIIDEQGSQDCNQIMIGDANEVWCFQQLSGHQWIAVKFPKDVASVNPNMSDLQFPANIDDSDTCLHSADLVKTAEDAGSLVKEKDGSINVAASYGTEEEPRQNTRYVQGHKYFGEDLKAGTDYTLNKDGAVESIASPSLYFTPGSKVGTFEALRAVAARGEGTDVDANANDKLYAIGNPRTVESHIFQTRAGLDADIATIQWEALSRGEFSIFVPGYSALLTEVDTALYPNEADFKTDHVGNENETVYKKDADGNVIKDADGNKVVDEEASKQAAEENEKTAETAEDSGYLDYVFMDINTLSYNNREQVGTAVHTYLDVLQKDIISEQEDVDALMQKLPAGTQRNAFANAAHKEISNEVYAKGSALRSELQAYITKGDFSKPFVPSDLGKDGELAEPLQYASKMKDFDAEKAAADVKEPVAQEAAEAAASGEEQASTGVSTGSISLFGFFVAFGALLFGCKKMNK